MAERALAVPAFAPRFPGLLEYLSKMRYSIVVAGLFARLSGAIKPPLAQPTNALLEVDLRGVTPRPTDAPMQHYGLMRRSPAAAASGGSLLGWVGPDFRCLCTSLTDQGRAGQHLRLC